MNMGKQITELSEGSAIPGESSYAVAMGDGTGVKQVKHKTLVEQLLSDMELPYDETLAMLTETEADEDGEENEKQKIPNLQAISDWIASKIVNSLLATEEGFFMDARLGPVLDQRITANTNAIAALNSDLAPLKGLRVKMIEVTLNFTKTTQSGIYTAGYTFDEPVVILATMGFVGGWIFNPIGFGDVSGSKSYVFSTLRGEGNCKTEIVYLPQRYVDYKYIS